MDYRWVSEGGESPVHVGNKSVNLTFAPDLGLKLMIQLAHGLSTFTTLGLVSSMLRKTDMIIRGLLCLRFSKHTRLCATKSLSICSEYDGLETKENLRPLMPFFQRGQDSATRENIWPIQFLLFAI